MTKEQAKSVYTSYNRDIGLPGHIPFTRGIHADMYRGRPFTMRQIVGFGGPEETNERIKFMLGKGATGISVVFDFPTIQMYDSDNPICEGEVGKCGVAVDSMEDMETLFKDIPLDEVTISLVTHYPLNTAILFSMFLAMANRRGVSWDKLRGSVQNDVTMEQVVASGFDYVSAAQCFRIQCDNAEFIRNHVPNWNFITLNGYNIREYGTSVITETAVAFSNGAETILEMGRRGYDVDFIAPRMAFFWCIGSDFFEEIARLRASRRVWCAIIKDRFGAKNERSMWMRCHAQTSGTSLTREEPLNNIVRSSYHALAAILGGVQSLHVDSYDEAYSVPTEQSALLSLRTQQIIQTETGITNVADPLGGSYYLESLTDEIERLILAELEEIDKQGGYTAVVEKGILRNRIEAYFQEQHRLIESGEIKMVGHNCLKSESEVPDIDLFEYPEGVEERQKDKLRELRRLRDNRTVEILLGNLRKACLSGENVFPHCLEAAINNVTEGEMFEVLKGGLNGVERTGQNGLST